MHASVAPFADAARESLQRELAERLMRHARTDGMHTTPIGSLLLVRSSSRSSPLPAVYQPRLCIVVQGQKRALVGEEVYVYDALNYLVVTVTLPARAHVVEATPRRPYLCLMITLDAALIAELFLQIGPAALAASESERGLYLARTSPPFLDAVLRLTALLDEPQHAAVLAPLILREIHYRALTGELGHRLRALTGVDGHAERISRAIKLLNARFTEPMRVEELAAAAHMSVSSLHHRFKEVTAMSPVQYQKHLRLHEARRLMLATGLDAAAAAHRVGYESASQFSREYRRLFGAPPRREIESLRAEAGGALES